MELYELVLDDETEKLVEVDEPLNVGDAVALGNEIWLVLRESERASVRGHSRFECRRALQLRLRAQELIAHADELQLKIAKAREARDRLDRGEGARAES
jgi:hypothetical protein